MTAYSHMLALTRSLKRSKSATISILTSSKRKPVNNALMSLQNCFRGKIKISNL